MKGVPEDGPEPYPTQPGGLSDEQLGALDDDKTPIAERLKAAREAGDYTVASILQSKMEREKA